MEKNKIIYFEQLDSTNTKITELAKQGAKHGTVVVADMQTAGKGRRGRIWESPKGTNIYMSILLYPKIEAGRAPMLTLVMAYSVARILKSQGNYNVQIKWPNDLVISGKKIGGILTEMEVCGKNMLRIIIGVGINANTRNFSDSLLDKATSLYLENGEEVNRKELVAMIVEAFREDYQKFLEVGNLSFLQDEYNQMLVNRDTEVRVLEPGNEYTAWAQGVNEKGLLIVRKEDGSEEAIFAGEVSVRGIYGYV